AGAPPGWRSGRFSALRVPGEYPCASVQLASRRAGGRGGRSGRHATEQAMVTWANRDAQLARELERLNELCLAGYRANPNLVKENHNTEVITQSGGYGDRQLYELIQNAADQMLIEHGRCEVLLTDSALYCANEGAPIDAGGLLALLTHNMSTKRKEEIGR